MINIKPGTTPILLIDMPDIDVTSCSDIRVTIKQYPVELTKVGELVTDTNAIYVSLSEAETRIFKHDEKCSISVRFVTEDGRVIKTDPYHVHILDTLNSGIEFDDQDLILPSSWTPALIPIVGPKDEVMR